MSVSVSRIVLSLGLVIAAMTAGAALYTYSASDAERPRLAQQEAQWAPSASEIEHHEAEPELQAEPVRFTNPFDASEVFEFPPGTSHAEAHEAVANLLMERAMERQGNARAGNKGP